jgi:hypothetical protein
MTTTTMKSKRESICYALNKILISFQIKISTNNNYNIFNNSLFRFRILINFKTISISLRPIINFSLKETYLKFLFIL